MALVKEYAEQIRGVSYKPEDIHDKLDMDSIALLRANNITDDGLIFDDLIYVDKSKVKEHQILKKGDILICASSGSKALVGKAAYVPKDINMTFGAFCKVVRPHTLDSEFFQYFFQSPSYRRRISDLAGGANINNIRNEHIDELSFPLPDLTAQRQIAATLDKVTEGIAICKQMLSDLDALVKARFVEMFGDPVSNSFGLPELTLPELGEFGRGVSKHRPRNDPALLGGKYPLIQTGEVAGSNLYITSYENTYSELGLKQSKMWSEGTLCITIAANIAKTAILGFDACFPDSIVGFNANERTNNIFIHYWFSFFQAILEAQAPESAQKNINLKTLSELKVIVPTKEKQDEFVSFVNQVDKSKVVIQQQLIELETLKKNLMQEYFG